MIYLLKKYATDQAIAEIDAAIQCYVHLSNMTSQQYGYDVIDESFKVADAYDKSTLNDVFIESLDASIRHSLCSLWPSNAQADLTDIAFEARSLL